MYYIILVQPPLILTCIAIQNECTCKCWILMDTCLIKRTMSVANKQTPKMRRIFVNVQNERHKLVPGTTFGLKSTCRPRTQSS